MPEVILEEFSGKCLEDFLVKILETFSENNFKKNFKWKLLVFPEEPIKGFSVDLLVEFLVKQIYQFPVELQEKFPVELLEFPLE